MSGDCEPLKVVVCGVYVVAVTVEVGNGMNDERGNYRFYSGDCGAS